MAEQEVNRLQAKWGLQRIQARKDEDRMVVAYNHDPLDPTVEMPRIPPGVIEKVTARLPVYEDIRPGRYFHREYRTEVSVRKAVRSENGVAIRFVTFSITAPDLPELTATYRQVLTGTLKPEAQYGHELVQTEEVR